MGELTETVGELKTAFTGSVDGKTKGVNARLDTLEGSEAGRKKITLGAILATIGGLITMAFNFFTGRGG